MSVVLQRVTETEDGTFGMLLQDGVPLCLTCELPWRENKRQVSCIPEGSYECVTRVSQRFNKHWHLQHVPGRDLILIHVGNNSNDIKGCILVGRYLGEYEGLTSVMDSKKTMQMLQANLPKEFTLEVKGLTPKVGEKPLTLWQKISRVFRQLPD
jgi:hypothetical protein